METELTQQQLAILDDLFKAELDEQAILDKHKISTGDYIALLTYPLFESQLRKRIKATKLTSELLIARYSIAAAAKLVRLTESEKEETARKACLDIIKLPSSQPTDEPQDQPPHEQISDELAAKILSALADEQPGDCDP